jgi:hypothetical protein
MGRVAQLRAAVAGLALAAICALASLACSPKVANEPPPKETPRVTHAPTPHPLPAALEADLAKVRQAPLAAVGFGEKAYSPYELVEGQPLVSDPGPDIVPRLQAEALDRRNDRVFRLVMLQILALRREPAVDAALLAALADPVLRPLAAYFLGRPGFKGYPARERKTVAPLLEALSAYLEDAGTYADPWYHRTYRTSDLVLGAFVRIAGPAAFTFVDPGDRDMVGYTLDLPEIERAGLLEQAKRWPAPKP